MISLKFFAGFVCVIYFLSSSFALPAYGSGGGGGLGNFHQIPRPYQFQWVVNQPDYGNDFGHKEHSDGNTVQGKYYVLLPDGRRQTVTYTADHNTGFIADVQYEGGLGGIGGIGGGGGYHKK